MLTDNTWIIFASVHTSVGGGFRFFYSARCMRQIAKKHRTPSWWCILRLWLQKNRPFAIISIPPSPPKNKNIPYWSCPLWTPSLTLPPSSLKCWQKSNPNIHRQCFRCFKCFGCFRCFISLLDHKTARFWSKSEQTRKIGTHPPQPYNGCAKHPKRQFTHLSTNTILYVL